MIKTSYTTDTTKITLKGCNVSTYHHGLLVAVDKCRNRQEAREYFGALVKLNTDKESLS